MTASDTIYIIDDDPSLRDVLALFLEAEGFRVETYPSSGEFLDAWRPGARGCAVLDISMPGMDGLTLQKTLHVRGIELPIIFLTGQGGVPQAVQAIKDGAVDFLEKPTSGKQLLKRIRVALADRARRDASLKARPELLARYERLTERERQVMSLVTSGLPNKLVARRLNISTRTAEGHRFRVMEKMQASSLSELTQMEQACKTLAIPRGSGKD
ncbi:MAG: response regulator [Thiogranum sp.]|jgi:FixJ family two-component response regulator